MKHDLGLDVSALHYDFIFNCYRLSKLRGLPNGLLILVRIGWLDVTMILIDLLCQQFVVLSHQRVIKRVYGRLATYKQVRANSSPSMRLLRRVKLI